jgi:hypothetical protein
MHGVGRVVAATRITREGEESPNTAEQRAR